MWFRRSFGNASALRATEKLLKRRRIWGKNLCPIKSSDQKIVCRMNCLVPVAVFHKEKTIFSRDKLEFSHHLNRYRFFYKLV